MPETDDLTVGNCVGEQPDTIRATGIEGQLPRSEADRGRQEVNPGHGSSNPDSGRVDAGSPDPPSAVAGP